MFVGLDLGYQIISNWERGKMGKNDLHRQSLELLTEVIHTQKEPSYFPRRVILALLMGEQGR